MFIRPLRRDPLVVGWALVMLFAVVVALSNNTTWSGHLEADRVEGFLQESAFAFVLSFVVLLFLAWFRAQTGGGPHSRVGHRTSPGPASAARAPFEPYPWTDRWLRDWREADARQAADPGSGTTWFENPYWWKEALFPVLVNVNVIELPAAV